MPPLLAALLMIEFQCNICIIAAIDLNMEWRRLAPYPRWISISWNEGLVGRLPDEPNLMTGTYEWPVGVGYSPVYNRSNTIKRLP